ncbi:MAG: hypothetical protein ACXAAH_09660 [Promethearchaeota archaeon]|jgi:hypothetical protein
MGSNEKEEGSPSLTALLVNHSQYITSVPDEETPENNEIESPSLRFEEASYDIAPQKTDRWKLGSQIGSVSARKHKEFRKLKYLHQSISTKENDLDSKTIKRNLHFASLLVQWFPELLIDQAVVELNKTDRTKVVADEAVVCRILGYIEALLRVSCRSVPWKTIFEINNELGMNIDKKEIAAWKFRAVASNAFKEFYKKRGNKETFDVIRFHIVRLVADLEVSPNEQYQKKEILTYSRQLCKYLEVRKLVPKDPEIYWHAIVEIACKKVLRTRSLRTLKDPRLKKKLSTAIHYIKKQCKKS